VGTLSLDQALAQLICHSLLEGFITVLGALHQVCDLFFNIHCGLQKSEW
jgi:hypothetical protein